MAGKDPLLKYGTSTITVPAGPQDPTVHLTQSFWMVVVLQIFVANQI